MRRYKEEWTVIINKKEYILSQEQAEILKEAILSGNRGIIVFEEFAINIPFIKEFFLSGKVYEEQHALPSGEKAISKEEWKRTRKSMEEFKRRFFARQKASGKKKKND